MLEKLNIRKNDTLTVVGAGGKTSFINFIANFYKNKFNILLTTTTKIYIPSDIQYNDIIMIEDNIAKIKNNKKGVIIVGKYINKENKIIGLDSKQLDSLSCNFDITLIEGDGSKKKKLKGWNDTEPVVYKNTTKTIGILDITSLGMKIDNINIHRVEEFEKITENSTGLVDIYDLNEVVVNPKGLFKNAVGEKYLFINKVENKEYEYKAKELINIIKKNVDDVIIFYGSIKNKIFKYS